MTWNNQPLDFTPKYQTETSWACDLMANCNLDVNNVRRATLPPRASMLIDCGLEITPPPGYKVCIDIADYLKDKGGVVSSNVFSNGRRVAIRLRNMGREILIVEHGEKFAQMWLEPIIRFDFGV